MKNRNSILYILFFFLLVNVLVSEDVFSQQVPTNEEIEAEAVLVNFLDSLIIGDVAAIRDLLGGKLLAKRTKLLNNPDYSAFLREIYSNAGFKIVRHITIEENKVGIDIDIIFNELKIERLNFLLIKEANATTSIPMFRIHEIVDKK